MKKEKVVLGVGVFDIIHLGHIDYLNQARKLGDKVVILVASDSRTKMRKGFHYNSQEIRAEVIKNLKQVDEVVMGKEWDPERENILDILYELEIDTILLPHDDAYGPAKVLKKISQMNLAHSIEVVQAREFCGPIFDKYEYVTKFGDKDAKLDRSTKNKEKMMQAWAKKQEA